ncbi:MAG: hypothetical protein MHM6MM_006118 [Cercozoa sp. M6MM]
MSFFAQPPEQDFVDAKIARMRAVEEARKERILGDPKGRIIGVHVADLAFQVSEKEAAKQLEARERIQADRERMAMAAEATKLHKLHSQMRHEEKLRCASINAKLAAEAEKCDCYDLNDPEWLKKQPFPDMPFEGEDASFQERQRRQREQQRRWVLEQMNEKMKAKEQEEEERLADDKQRVEMDQLAVQIDLQRREIIAAEQHYVRTYNLKLADEVQKRTQAQNEFESRLDAAEIEHWKQSELLAIGRGQTLGERQGQREFFKGFSREQLATFVLAQRQQIEEKEMRLREYQDRQKRDDEIRMQAVRLAEQLAQQQRQERESVITDMNAENARLKQEQARLRNSEQQYQQTPHDPSEWWKHMQNSSR